MINKQQCATAAPRRSKPGFGFSQTGCRLRLWELLSIGQDEARPVLASAKPGAVSAFGLYFPTGKSPQLESRREMAVDSGRDARLVRNRPGETRSASPGLSGKAKAAVPVFRLPRIIPFPAVSPKRSAAETWAGTRTKIRRLLPVEPLGGASSQRLGPESRSASVDSPGRAKSPFPSSVSLRA